jgi:hypothetical protein
VTDLQISLTSLEEVFLSIARRAEVEAAAGETAAVELPDGGTVEVGGVACGGCCAVRADASLAAVLPGWVPAGSRGPHPPPPHAAQVALGEEWATDAQGRHYFIRWAQDDSGALQVLKAEPVQARPATLAGAGGAAVAPEGGASGSSGPGSSTGGEPVQQAPQVVEMARSAP